MEKQNKVACFIGHRPKDFESFVNKGEEHPTWLEVWLDDMVYQAINDLGIKHFICGNGVGVDTWAAQIVLAYKEEYPDVVLEIAIPYEYHNFDHEMTRAIHDAADVVTVVSEQTSGAYVKCRKYIVDHSDIVLAATVSKGGNIIDDDVKQSIEYARSVGKEPTIYNLEMYDEKRRHEEQKIFDKKELSQILFEMKEHINLLICLAGGKAADRYTDRLLLTATKFSFVSSMFYKDNETLFKLPYKSYKEFFENYVDTCEKVARRLNKLGVDTQKSEEIFCKYQKIKEVCLPMIAEQTNVYSTNDYLEILECVIEDKPLPTEIGYKNCEEMMAAIQKSVDTEGFLTIYK